MKIVPTG